MSGRQRRRGERARDHELLRQALDDRAGLSRHQGPSFRHGLKRSSHRRSATARPASSLERVRHRSPDAARRRRRDAVEVLAGRQLAAGIPGADFIALPGRNHLFLEHEPACDRFFEEISLFLKG